MESFILDPFALATDGTLAPTSAEDYCLQPFALASAGQFVIEVEAGNKLADPRFREPWDPDYYRWKYRKEIARLQSGSERPRRSTPKQPDRPDIMRDMLDQARLDQLDARNVSNERDILELQAYIQELTTGLEDEALRLELEAANQEALLQRLEENVRLAREALLVALEARRRHQNRVAAIEAMIRLYF